MPTDAPDSAGDRSARPTIAGFAATRLIGNLFVRFPYVFITKISRGLGVDVETLTLVFGLRELGGLVAPVSGRWVDRGHTARVIGWGGLIAGASCAAAATTQFGLFVVVMVTGGAAKISIDLAQNAWIGHRIPLAQRGRVVGLVEMTWAGAFLVGIPLLGLAVDRWGWQAAFLITGPLLAVTAIASAVRLPPERPALGAPDAANAPDAAGSPVTPGPPVALGDERTGGDAASQRVKRAVWIFCVMQPTAQMLIFAVNSDWFVRELGLTTAGLGVASALLGLAELIGTGLAVLLTDRFGPLRCGMWGILLTVPPLLLIIGVGTNVAAAVGLMVLMDIAIEFGFVAVLPMVSELDVDNRGRAVGHVFVLIMVARAMSSAAAGVIYTVGGFEASIIAAAIACLIGGAALAWGRRPVGPALVAAGS